MTTKIDTATFTAAMAAFSRVKPSNRHYGGILQIALSTNRIYFYLDTFNGTFFSGVVKVDGEYLTPVEGTLYLEYFPTHPFCNNKPVRAGGKIWDQVFSIIENWHKLV